MKIIGVLISLAGFLLPGHPALGQKQGIKGEVFWLSGNQMPGPGQEMAPKLGAKREIYIYELTTLKDAEQHDTFFFDVKTKLIAKTLSRDDGRFKAKLPPGKYSLFIKEPKGLFANLFTRAGEINPVTVKVKKYTWISITVDYEATY
jgi:hypothetical protein